MVQVSKNIEALIEDGGEITLGALPPHDCAATAVDGSNCLAMLVHRDGETLNAFRQGVAAASLDDRVHVVLLHGKVEYTKLKIAGSRD